MEDVNYGMFLGTEAFIDRIRSTYMPDRRHRGLPVLFMWNTGLMTNEEIGALFGLTYSSVTHIVRPTKSRLSQEAELERRLDWINSQCKV